MILIYVTVLLFTLVAGCEVNSFGVEKSTVTYEYRLEQKTYQDFLDALRTFESSIDPAKAKFYGDSYNDPSAIRYQKVVSPGRVLRDRYGDPIMETTSIKKYFQKLGVDHLYYPGSTDKAMFEMMQYSVTNFLGFIGYQFSEQDLWTLGYYTHFDRNGLPEYYSDLPNSTWANGVHDKIVNLPNAGRVHVTDVNTWRGKFTGKHGVYSMADFKNPEKQDQIARDHFAYKYQNIVRLLAARGKTVQEYIGTVLYWDQCKPVVSPPPSGRSNSVTITVSGLLAGAHLRGAAGVVDLLLKHENHADEIGTRILQYVQDYGAYDTPFLQENSKTILVSELGGSK